MNLRLRPPAAYVFIASTEEDLGAYRKAAADAIRGAGCVAIMHEDWSGSSRPTVEECKRKVRKCDALVAISAYRYGWVPTVQEGGDGKKSITWIEWNTAADMGIERFPFRVNPKAPWPDQWRHDKDNPQAQLQLFNNHMGAARLFSTPEDLGSSVRVILEQFQGKRALRWVLKRFALASVVLILIVGFFVWLFAQRQTLSRQVSGRVVTTGGHPVREGAVNLFREGCSGSSRLMQDGTFVISLEHLSSECRKGPFGVSVSLPDGRMARGESMASGNIEIKIEPSNRVQSIREISKPLFEIVLEKNPLVDASAYLLNNDLWVPSSRPAGREGLLVTSMQLMPNSEVDVNVLNKNDLLKKVKDVEQSFQGETKGLDSLYILLSALQERGLDNELLPIYEEMILNFHPGEKCEDWQRLLKWFHHGIKPSSKLYAKKTEFETKESLACSR